MSSFPPIAELKLNFWKVRLCSYSTRLSLESGDSQKAKIPFSISSGNPRVSYCLWHWTCQNEEVLRSIYRCLSAMFEFGMIHGYTYLNECAVLYCTLMVFQISISSVGIKISLNLHVLKNCQCKSLQEIRAVFFWNIFYFQETWKLANHSNNPFNQATSSF